MSAKDNVSEIIKQLENEYPDALCSLVYNKDYELMISVRLAAQCTDERVNKVTPALFQAYPTLESIAAAQPEDIEPYVRSCGFYHGKARDIVLSCRMLISDYNSKVPNSMEKLLKLPGVGRKTANLLLGDIYKKPSSVVVDTHCIRLSNRIGFVDKLKDPGKIETILRDILPPEKSNDFCHRCVLHGRAVCTARCPKCDSCCIRHLCDTGLGVKSL
jgi:endonuclease-3